jgi:DNA-binding SARP family transcriptional activator
LAWSLCAVSAAFGVLGGALYVVGDPALPGLDYDLVFVVAFLGFGLVGALIASRVPSNPIGWLLLAQGVAWELSAVLAGYANISLFARPGSLPGGEYAAWTLNWMYLPAFGALVVVLFLFPDGHLLSSRWVVPVVWLGALSVGLLFAADALGPGPLHEAPPVANPLGIVRAESVFGVLRDIGDDLSALVSVAAVLVLVFRFRRAGKSERQQVKWLAVAGLLVVVAFAVGDVLDAAGLPRLGENVAVSSVLAVPVAVGVAVLGYRLYDIDVVIGKTVVYGGLVGFVTAVYVAVVVGIGDAVGRGAGSNLGLAVVATAVVATAFQPVRERLHRVARKFVFGAPTPAEEQAGVAVNCLGAFRVFRDGDVVPVSAWQSKKARTLLKLLVARRGRATTREFLMETLWPGEDPELVTRRLSVALATVRAVLDPNKHHPPDHFVVADKDAIRVDVAHLPIDVERFLSAATDGLALVGTSHDEAAKAKLIEAADAYAGEFLEEDSYEDWAIPLREEARATSVAVLRALATLAEQSGDVDQAIRYHLRVLEADPWEERSHLGVVTMMEKAGRHGEARRLFQTYTSRMEELGVTAAPFPTSGPV